MNDKPLDDKTVYIFIRQDLSLALQLVHVGHACFHLGLQYGLKAVPFPKQFKVDLPPDAVMPVGIQQTNLETLEGIPFAAVIGMPDLNAMHRVGAKLTTASIPLFAWEDPDEAEGVTCIVTEPVAREQREALGLRKYRLWNPDDPTRVLIQTILGDGAVKGKTTIDALREVLTDYKKSHQILDAT